MIKTILLADDSITMQKVIRLTFASGGYELVTADNGAEAIKKAEDLRPHIIMVDAALPGKNGYEVCEAIKNNYRLKDTPVLLLAGTFNPLDENEAKRVKADDSIVKPFESKHLIEKVEHLFRKFPPVEREEGGQDSPAPASKENIWEEDDIIQAPEPSPISSMTPPPDTGTPEDDRPLSTSEIPGFETFDGRGYLNGNGENTSGQGAESDEQMPDMKTAEGDSEGVGGFDIEGFEINPFKSEPLREEPIFEEPKDSSDSWGVDEKDVSGFDDLEPENEIEAEEAAGEPTEDADENQAVAIDIEEQSSGYDDAICEDESEAGIDEPEEDVIVAEEEPSEEETAAIETEEENAESNEGIDEGESGAGVEETGVEETEEEITITEELPAEEEIAAAEAEEETSAIETEEETAESNEDIDEGESETGAEETEEEITIAEEGPAEEETAAAIDEKETAAIETSEEICEEPLSSEEAPDRADEDTIRALVRKASMDVIEEVVRDVVPGLIKKALEDEIERIKETLKTI